ncbi:MAG: rhodanese-like domain-containing protein [Alphaproteobacteria bacterium]|nr:rhodanese-like domain-containing protein [Alphaproteobacteria bacterium]
MSLAAAASAVSALDAVRDVARDRVGNDAGYAGDVTASEAWTLLKETPDAVLIDVRTPPEWAFTGVPDLRELKKDLVTISWRSFPTYEVNPQFMAHLAEVAPSKNAPLVFLCRTGGRSLDAARAATAAGYAICFNVLDGFEGPMNEFEQRGGTAGWKAEGIPWRQT